MMVFVPMDKVLTIVWQDQGVFPLAQGHPILVATRSNLCSFCRVAVYFVDRQKRILREFVSKMKGSEIYESNIGLCILRLLLMH